jgi:DNA-binding CsgD family transcriptional regulator
LDGASPSNASPSPLDQAFQGLLAVLRSVVCEVSFTLRYTTGIAHDLGGHAQCLPYYFGIGTFMAGARGYLLKSDANRHLIDAIEALSSHRPFFSAKVSEALLESFRHRGSGRTSPLTSRERSVLQLIAEGHTNKEVGGVLNISLKTVESHRAAIMRKLNLSSPAALVRYAIRNKIVEP